MIQPESGPVCLLGTEFQKKVCWEILVAGSEQGIEAGQVGLRLITKGDRQTTVAKEWSISATSIADGRSGLFLYQNVLSTIQQDCSAYAFLLSFIVFILYSFISHCVSLSHGFIVLLLSVLHLLELTHWCSINALQVAYCDNDN